MREDTRHRKAVEMIHTIEKADEEMLGRLFKKALQEQAVRDDILEKAWDMAEDIVQNGAHVDRFVEIVKEEGFADNDVDAIEIVTDLVDLWIADVSAMIRKGIE